MYFTINQQNAFPYSIVFFFCRNNADDIQLVWHVLEAKPWAIFTEIGRLLLMGATFVIVLYQHDLITLIGWVSILTLLLVGASLLYISFFFRYGKTEGEAFPLVNA
jgi:hypothetical protein